VNTKIHLVIDSAGGYGG